MSELRIYDDKAPQAPLQQTDNTHRISAWLNQAHVRFEHWDTDVTLESGAAQESILAAYRNDIDRLVAEGGYQSVDVISLTPTHPDRQALREKFLREHRHTEDEVRFFVDGRGLFALRIEDRVYEVICERGDLISVPAQTPHWFDMGPNPRFTAIRLFTDSTGWVAHYTGNDIAERFSRLDE